MNQKSKMSCLMSYCISPQWLHSHQVTTLIKLPLNMEKMMNYVDILKNEIYDMIIINHRVLHNPNTPYCTAKPGHADEL